MNLIEKSLKIALSAHQGEQDKAGRPYILHPLRVMLKMTNDFERSAALLHDVLEHSKFTPAKLTQEGIPRQVIDAVLCLTDEKTAPYDQYIDRLSKNKIARRVKIADLEDNLDILRLNEITDDHIQYLNKYHRAWHKLNALEHGL